MSHEANKESTAPTETTSSGVSRRRKPLLRILLDTNQLFTGSASDLLSAALRKLIEESRSHSDIQIEWLIPEVVRWEREYQMVTAARRLLPALIKLEHLLGYKLGISEERLSSLVGATIDRQVRDLAINVVCLDVKNVDWNAVVLASAFRYLPFDRGEKEKGFRDAIIAECFAQTITESPSSPSACRIAVVTGDGLLAETMKSRTKDCKNVRILRSLDDLQSLINTLVSSVTEEFVASFRDPAERLFFSTNSQDGLFYKEKIREDINRRFDAKLRETPRGADSRENGTWTIVTPSFVGKSGQRIVWRTSIKVEATAFKINTPEGLAFGYPTHFGDPLFSQTVIPSSPVFSSEGLIIGDEVLRPYGGLVYGGFAEPKLTIGDTPILANTIVTPAANKTPFARGHTLFHVTWSVTITTTGKLSRPKIELIEWKETLWQ